MPHKHRVMRIAGIDEEMITGVGISGKERYDTWASIFTRTIGNPLFHWSCLELKRFFGIDEILNRENAGRYGRCAMTSSGSRDGECWTS